MTEAAQFTDLISKVIDNRGKTCPTAERGIPLIATNCVKNETLYPVFEKVRYVSDETYRTWFRAHPITGDLIFVTKGSPGQVCLAPDPVNFCIAQDMVAVRANPSKVYPLYLFAALRSPQVQADIGNMHVGTLIPHFKKGDFDKLKIPLPSTKQQIATGDFYHITSQKIELNRRMNETLEAMAQAIFRDWFVDFGPTRRKLEGATDPLTIMGGLVQDAERAQGLADLFPVTLGDDGLPEGWREEAIGDLMEIVGGSTPSTGVPDFWEEGVHPWATPKDLSKLDGMFLAETERCVTDAGLAKIGSGLSPIGTVLLSSRAPIGYLAVAAVPVAVNQGFIALRPSPRMGTAQVLFWCRENMDVIKAHANGSTFMEISKKNFRPLPVVRGSDQVSRAFDEVVSPFLALIQSKSQENRTLAATRDLLLPRLMSGEIRLSEAEELMEAAQ